MNWALVVLTNLKLAVLFIVGDVSSIGQRDVDASIFNDHLFHLDREKSYYMTVHAPMAPKFHNQVINADKSLELVVGIKAPSTFCGLAGGCEQYNKTLVDYQLRYLMTEAEGSQEIVTLRSGSIQYTREDHPDVAPPAERVKFQWEKRVDKDGTGLFTWNGAERWCMELLMCDSTRRHGEGRYAIVASVCHLNQQRNCKRIHGVELHEAEGGRRFGAWEYGVGETETVSLPGDDGYHGQV